MERTPRMLVPYPGLDQEPFYDTFRSMVLALDASLYAGREDRQVFLLGGGTFTFDSVSGLLTWNDTINVTASVVGFLWQLESGSINLQDGQFLYVELVRSPTKTIAVTALASYQVPSSDAAFAIAFRKGTRIYFRNGRVLLSGDSLAVLDLETSASGGGSDVSAVILSGQTALGFVEGNVGYASANNDWTKARADATRPEAVAAAAYLGVVGKMAVSGSIVNNARFTAAGGSPSPGAEVFLALNAEDGGTGLGKFTATAPSTAGQYMVVLGVCVDNTNWVASKTSKVIFTPRSPILIT